VAPRAPAIIQSRPIEKRKTNEQTKQKQTNPQYAKRKPLEITRGKLLDKLFKSHNTGVNSTIRAN